MNRFLAVVLMLTMMSSPLPAQVSPQSGLPGWLAGTWVMESGASWADETWTVPRGGMMLGAGRRGFGQQLDEWEHARIERKVDGSISYFTQPKGRPANEYPLSTLSDLAIEFANPVHDYPQRIRYERVGQLLIAETSRMDGSDAVRWQYRLVGS